MILGGRHGGLSDAVKGSEEWIEAAKGSKESDPPLRPEVHVSSLEQVTIWRSRNWRYLIKSQCGQRNTWLSTDLNRKNVCLYVVLYMHCTWVYNKVESGTLQDLSLPSVYIYIFFL